MAKFFTLFVGIIFAFTQAMSQTSNLMVFSEKGESFSISLNGNVQNTIYQPVVKITNLDNPYYQMRVDFKDGNIPPIHKNVFLTPGKETTLMIKLNPKGEYVIRFRNEVAISNQNSIGHNLLPIVENLVSIGLNIASGTTTENNNNKSYTNPQDNASDNTGETTDQNTIVVEDYTEPGNNTCRSAMATYDFFVAKQTISSQLFDESKMITLKQVVESNCLNVSQVKELMQIFLFEEQKLDVARTCYSKTIDKNNYYQVNELFGMSSTIKSLNDYIKANP